MKALLLGAVLAFLALFGQAQNVGIGTTTPDASAKLEVNSTEKGILFPRVTTAQRKAIVAPALGLMVFDIEKNMPYYFNGAKWMPLAPVQPSEVQPVEYPGTSIVFNNFGTSVAMAGTYAAVGITRYDTSGMSDVGAVRIYSKMNGKWSPIQMIVAQDRAQNDMFGYSIDMQGDYLVVGVPSKTVATNSSAGKVYVYKMNSSTGLFELEAEITNPNGNEASSLFGWSVAITNTSSAVGGVAVAVGAPRVTVGGTRKGMVSLFRRTSPDSYLLMNTIYGIQTSELFGSSVDIDGNLVVMGAPDFDSTHANGRFYSNCGRVQVNRFNVNNYSAYDFTFRPILDTSTNYGSSVSISNNSIVFGGSSAGTGVIGRPQGYSRSGIGNYAVMSTFPQYPGNQELEADYNVMGYQVAVTPKLLLIGIPHSYNSASGGSAQGGKDYSALFKKNANTIGYDYYGLLVPPGQYDNNTDYGGAVAASGSDYIIGMSNAIASDGVTQGAVFFGTIEE